MTGLLIKDIRLLQKQSRFFLVFLLLYGAFLLAGGPDYSLFLICYLTFVFTMFSISSFSYDEYDNSMAFLLSLPVSRSDYVKEKYVFSVLMSFIGWTLSILMLFVVTTILRTPIDWIEYMSVSLIYLAGVWFFQSVSLPLIFRFGPEKGRTASFVFLGGIAGVVFILVKYGVMDSMDSSLDALFSSSRMLMIIGTFVAVTLAGLLLSYVISKGFMKKREF